MKKIWKQRYQIIDKLGQGGGGSVYKVRDMNLEKIWALKFIEKKGMYQNSGKAEWEICKKISHGNFPRVVDAFEEDGKYAIVMDWIKGVTLEEIIEKGPIEEGQMIVMAKQICEALHYLHLQSSPLLYLDLKPSNIMIEEDGCVKLIDMGSVMVKGEKKMVSGTFGFASPEQIGGNGESEFLNEQSDIFSFGMVLYAMVKGNSKRLPIIERGSKRGVWVGEKNPKLSAMVEKIIEKCTRGEREKRYFSMREVKRELERWEQKRGKMLLGLPKRIKKRDFQWYQEKSILCTEGNHSFYIAKRLMIIAFFLLAFLVPKKKLNVVLRDQEMRKVLVKQGCAYETSSNLLLEIPWEEIEGENCRIIVECKDQSAAKKRFYIDCVLAN